MHGPPLAHASCNPPSPASDNLTVGTQDANAKAANSVGSFRYAVRVGDPGTPADEADVAFEFRLSDVRVAGTLADYSGEVQPRATMRMTDRRSLPGGERDRHRRGPGAAVHDPVRRDSGREHRRGLQPHHARLDAITPGLVREGARAIWALGPVEVIDGGTDGDVDTAPNQVFARQGIFIP